MAKKSVKSEQEKNNIDLDVIKEDLKEYVDKQINKKYVDEIERINKKMLREKTKRIIIKDIVILVLLAAIIYLLYILYSFGIIGKILKIDCKTSDTTTYQNNETIVQTNESNKTIVEDNKPTLEDLKKEYGFLIDKIVINENSTYIDDFYNGNLTGELRNYITLNQIDFNNIEKEDGYSIINNSLLEEEYKKLFNTSYEKKSFDYDGNIIKYMNRIDSYVSLELINKNISNIKREITSIVLVDNQVKIKTIEGIIIDNKIYDKTMREVGVYKNDLSNYSDKLMQITYVFSNNLLIKIEK